MPPECFSSYKIHRKRIKFCAIPQLKCGKGISYKYDFFLWLCAVGEGMLRQFT
jgi:hypothetical protein